MKIVSQPSNAVPDATSKSAPSDASKSTFQSTLAAAIGDVVAASGKGDSNSVKTKDVDPKKTSSPDSKKKIMSSNMADGTITPTPTPQAPVDGAQLIPVPHTVPLDITSQFGESGNAGASVDQTSAKQIVPDVASTSVVGGDSGILQIAGVLALQVPTALDDATAEATASVEKVSATDSGLLATEAKQATPAMTLPPSENSSTLQTKISDAIAGKTASDIAVAPASAVAADSKAVAAAAAQAKSGALEEANVLRRSSNSDATSQSQASAPAQQTTPQALTQSVPPQTLVQGTNQPSAVVSTGKFMMPEPKSGTSASATANAGSMKGKTASNRTYGTTDATDDEQDATGADSGPMKAQIGASEVISKDAPGGAGELMQGTALAQSTHAAQVAAPTHSADTAAATTQSTSVAASSGTPAQAASADNVQAAHAMSNAQLIQSAHGSEMRLGMQSAEFGNISISTSLNHQALSAQISIDHSALGHALAAHLPAIEEKLGSAYGVQAKVELRDTGANSSSNDSERGSEQNSQSRGGAAGSFTGAASGWSVNSAPSTITSSVASSSRLDIRI